jgi:hypothetical protein
MKVNSRTLCALLAFVFMASTVNARLGASTTAANIPEHKAEIIEGNLDTSRELQNEWTGQQKTEFGGNQNCMGKGVFVPASLQGRCCNGAERVVGGYRCA